MPIAIDWSTLTIIGRADDDRAAKAVVDEDKLYEAMGFKESEPTPEEGTQEVPIPAMSAEMQVLTQKSTHWNPRANVRRVTES